MISAIAITRRAGLMAVLAVPLLLVSPAPALAAGLSTTNGDQVAGPPLPDYPKPPLSEKRLFYLQRSTNANTVVYDANYSPSGRLDPNRPVEVYWLRYNTNGEKRKLSFVERNMAYGVESETASLGQSSYRVNVVSLKSRSFDVSLDKKGRPRAIMTIDGRPARLQFVYLTVDDGGLLPDVQFVDFYGEDVASGTPVHERYRP